MALSKRKSRTISVNGVKYRWALSPDSGCMWLIIEDADSPGQLVEARFDIHDAVAPDGRLSSQRACVSPGVVRTIILHALHRGWHPQQRGLKALRIDGDVVSPLA